MVTAQFLADITGPMGPVGDLARGTMPMSSNANNFTSSGLWYSGGLSTVATHTNLAVLLPSSFFVLASDATFSITQFQMPNANANTNVYWRSKQSSAAWSPWQSLNFDKGTMPANTDASSLFASGNYYTGGVSTVGTHTNLAENVPSAFHVLGGGNNFSASQIQIPVSGGAKFYFRTKQTSSTWTPWVNLLSSGGGGSGTGPAVNWGATPATHQWRLQDFMAAYPLYTSGGKGCVVFRYDHGLTNFKSMLLGLHQTAGIGAYIAMNSRNWTAEENSGATIAEAAAWANIEWGNHTADHRDRNTDEGIYDAIVNGRKELEAQLGRKIHGFTVPGLSEYNSFEGFSTGSLDSYSETLAGGLILANHAIVSGAAGTAQRPLDGLIRQGGRHFTWESATWTAIKAQIDLAVTGKTALTLMAHPRLLGTAGYADAALASQVITYVKDRIDAGELANISYYQSHHAKL